MLKKLFYVYLFVFSFAFANLDGIQLKLQEVKSKYGIRALLVQNKNLPTVTISFVFKNSGYVYDEPNKGGLSNLVSLILQEGTQTKDKLTFAKEMAKIGAQISFGVDQEYFYCNIRILAENIGKAFALFHEIIFSPNLDEQSIKRAKTIQKAINEKAPNNPYQLASSVFFTKAFAGTPYANTKYGTEKNLEAITVADIHDFISNTFNRINLSVSVVGNIDEVDLIKLLDDYIVDFPLTVLNVKKIDKKARLNKGDQINVEQNIPQNVIIFAQNGLSVHDKDFYNLLIMNYVLGGSGLKSVLTQEIREKRGYTYGIRTELYNTNNLNLVFGSLSVANENANEAIALIKKTIGDFQANGITQAQLERAKSDIIAALLLNLDLSVNVLDNIVYIQKNDLSVDYLNDYLNGIKAVKLSSLNNFIKSFIDTKSLFFVNVGKTV